MAPSAVRSFAITFAIAIAIIGPPACGFATNRSYIITTPKSIHSQDISPHGQLEDIKITDREDSNRTTIGNSKETSTQTSTKKQEKETEKPPTAQTTARIKSTTEYMKIPTITSDTVEVFDSVEDVTENKNKHTSTEASVDLSQSVISLPKKSSPASTENPKNINHVTATIMITEKMATDPETTKEHSTNISIDNIMTPTKLNEITSTYDHILTTTMVPTVTKAEALVTTPEPTTDVSLTITEKSFTSTNLSGTTTEASTKVLTNSQMADTTLIISSTSVIEPLRKNYTTIVRKRTSSAEPELLTTQSESEPMKAETSNTFMNYEKVDVTPMLEKKVTIAYLPNTNVPKPSVEDSGKTTLSVSTMVRSLNSIESTEDKGTTTIQSKRAGYLDNSGKSTNKSGESKEQEPNDKKIQGTGDTSKTTAISTHYMKASSSESQSQLAEDALREEFLEEEAIKDRQENIHRYRNEDYTSTNATDTLSVQPIEQGPDRSRTTLYTISPNYKPMKKIDVQPAKPFVRDPDDNSWRNESISSLGIVFKPKNSSISFKEVLKNKTQTELNSLLEKDATDDVPDLRVRLEKIAEVRKTKKKKTYKDGEVVYTDYEEGGSAEGNNTGKTETIFSPPGFSGMLTSTTSPQTPVTDVTMTTPMSAVTDPEKEINSVMGLFNALAGGPPRGLTTHKPNRPFNIAEYYDTTDEYDADYVTLPKIDLKKFTVKPLTTRLPASSPLGHSTRPMRPQYPDRKPTVQYFPPRKPQTAGNDVNADFERKVNSFTLEHPPQPQPQLLQPQPQYMTVPAEPNGPGTPEVEARPDSYETPPRPPLELGGEPRPTPAGFTLYTPKELYLSVTPARAPPDAGAPHRGSYLIKHYGDFLDAVARDEEDDRSPFAHFSPPPRSFDGSSPPDAQLRRDALARFVDDFNRNSERFKVEFPVLYNSSVVHRAGAGGRGPASSRAFLRRLYGEGAATRAAARRCDACELAVELSPAYELHYYVPDQEEKEQLEPRATSVGGAPRTLPPRPPL